MLALHDCGRVMNDLTVRSQINGGVILGVGYAQLAEECRLRHQIAYPPVAEARAHRELQVGGEYQWRREGEYHLFNPLTIHKLQHAARSNDYEAYKEYADLINDRSQDLGTLRGLLDLKFAGEPIPLEEVEPASEIVKRFCTGAMNTFYRIRYVYLIIVICPYQI